MEKGKNIL